MSHLFVLSGWARQVLWCSYLHQGRDCRDRKWQSRYAQQCPEGKYIISVKWYLL